MRHFDELVKAVDEHPIRKVAVAVAQDTAAIGAVVEARKRNVAESILVGNQREILEVAASLGVSVEGMRIVDESDPIKAVAAAVQLVSTHEADILMKGHIHTDDLIRGVLHREHGLRTGSIMSHVFIVEDPERNKLIFITDAAMNIAPDLEQKAAILLNAVYVASLFGVHEPKVAVLAAVELVNPKMQATLDAAALSTMTARNQYVPHAVVDGPFGLDNAVSPEAARHKGIAGPVAGEADILIVPEIEAGNILVKSLVHFAHRRVIGLLIGANAPVVLTSRADSMEAKLLSMAGAVLMVNVERVLHFKIGMVHY